MPKIHSILLLRSSIVLYRCTGKLTNVVLRRVQGKAPAVAVTRVRVRLRSEFPRLTESVTYHRGCPASDSNVTVTMVSSANEES